MTMKKGICLAFLLLMTGLSGSYGQSLNFGIKGGPNFSNFEGSSANLKSESITSYHVGAFVDLGLSERVAIQPELLYSTVGAKVSIGGTVDEFKNKLGYISIPLLTKVYLFPDRLSIDIGPQVSFLLNEKENVNLGNSNSYDFSLVGGVTLRVLGPIFVQARYNYGIRDVKPNTEITNRVFQLSAGLRF
jgi:hypothetical protein